MSDIVLIYPRTGLDLTKVSVGLPMSLLAISSEIVGDFSVKIIDQRVSKNWEADLIEELKSKPLCVGISAMTGYQIFHGLRAARIVREHSEDVPIIWGGMHVTLTAEESIRHPLVDIIVKGDGEWTFRDLVRALAVRKTLEGVGGLYWKERGTVRKSDEAPSLVLDQTLPYPFELIDAENYVHHGEYLFPGIKRTLPFMGSRGCPFKCTFCSEPALTKVYKMMKPELIYERTSDMVRRFRLDMVTFYDEEFFVNSRWATRVAELIDGKFKWWTQTRANDLLRVDLQKLERCGLYVVAPGLESGSNRILKFIKKKETVDEYIEVNRRLAKTGIIAQYNLMMGFPGETTEELYETVDLCLRLINGNSRVYINSLSLFTPLPATELIEQSKQWGYRAPEGLEDWTWTSRHNFATPWLAEKLEVYLNLAYTSKFIGPRAKMLAQSYAIVPDFVFDLYSALIQRRWRKRIFKNTWDVRLLRYLHKRFVNPVLEQTKQRGRVEKSDGSPSLARSGKAAGIHEG